MAILTHFARKTLVVASASVASLPPPVPQRPFWKFWAKQPRAFAAVEAAEDPFMWCVRPLPPCAQMLPCPSSTTHARPSFFSPVPCLLGSRPMCASRACPPTWLPLPQRRGVSFLTSAARLTTPSLRPTAALATPTPPTPPSPSTPSPRPHSHARPRSSPTTPRSSPTTPRSSLHHPQILSHQPQILSSPPPDPLFTTPRSSPTSPRSSSPAPDPLPPAPDPLPPAHSRLIPATVGGLHCTHSVLPPFFSWATARSCARPRTACAMRRRSPPRRRLIRWSPPTARRSSEGQFPGISLEARRQRRAPRAVDLVATPVA